MNTVDVWHPERLCESPDMATDFYERLVSAYEAAGLDPSQSSIARSLDLGQSAVAKWAHGGGYPTLRKCIKIATLTGCNIEWLLTGRGPQKQEGGSMDELTQALLEQWADLSDESKREILAYISFRASQSENPLLVRAEHKGKSR